MFMTFLLFQSNLYVALACGKGPKNSIHRDLFKTSNPEGIHTQSATLNVNMTLGDEGGLLP